jgi:hypothetical protein
VENKLPLLTNSILDSAPPRAISVRCAGVFTVTTHTFDHVLQGRKGGVTTHRFREGLFVVVVVCLLVALLMALMRNEERRRQLNERRGELRNALPEREQLKQSAQQAAPKIRETRSALGELVRQSASRVSAPLAISTITGARRADT